MAPPSRSEMDESDDELAGANRGTAPELFNRRAKSQHVRKQARRNRSNDTAKRGMHQRRNKRVSW